jgi:hypothetical protein
MLEFRIELRGARQCTLQQVALFQPRGLFGLLYWYVAPLHNVVFSRNVAGHPARGPSNCRQPDGGSQFSRQTRTCLEIGWLEDNCFEF